MEGIVPGGAYDLPQRQAGHWIIIYGCRTNHPKHISFAHEWVERAGPFGLQSGATHMPGSGLVRANSWGQEQLGLLAHTFLRGSCWVARLFTALRAPGAGVTGKDGQTPHPLFSPRIWGHTVSFLLLFIGSRTSKPPHTDGRTIRFSLLMGSMSKV